MDMEIRLGDGDRVEAAWEGLSLPTDQDGSMPAPFDLFLASLGTCTGLYVSRFFRQRGLPTEGLRIRQRATRDPETRMVDRVEIDIALPAGFPEKYRDAVVRAANLCSVKRHLVRPPRVEVRAR